MKEIIISNHVALSMQNRGATEVEVISCIQLNERKQTKRGKLTARNTFIFGSISPVNQKIYKLKTVEAIFVDEPNAITVVTVKVYYHNE